MIAASFLRFLVHGIAGYDAQDVGSMSISCRTGEGGASSASFRALAAARGMTRLEVKVGAAVVV